MRPSGVGPRSLAATDGATPPSSNQPPLWDRGLLCALLLGVSAVLAAALVPATAAATPVQRPGGNSYEYIASQVTWAAAQAYAEDHNGHLATITDSDENEFVRGLISGASAWIGLTDQETEGSFKWVTDETYSGGADHWAPFQPDDDVGLGGGGDAAAMSTDGTWFDTNPNIDTLVTGFVIEYPAAPPAGATLHVTNADDGPAPTPTLRNQIAAAAPGDAIVIDPGVNPTLSEGEILVNKSLTIRGQGAGVTLVGSDQASRIFNIGSANPAAAVSIERLTLTNAASAPGASGGAVLNAATLTIDRSTLTGNTASGSGTTTGSAGNGGAISSSGSLSISRSTLSANSTEPAVSGADGVGFGGNGEDGGNAGHGGAISSSGSLTVSESTLSGNSTGAGGAGGDAIAGFAGDGGTGGDGGAMYLTGGDAAIVNSTFHGNSTGNGGAGGQAELGGGGADGEDRGSGSGGGVRVGPSAALTLSSSTLAANTNGVDGDGFCCSDADAASISTSAPPPAVVVKHSILSSAQPNCSGSLTYGGFNAVRMGGGADGSCNLGGTTELKLDPAGLADNGGPTPTIALLAGSAALDVVASGCPPTDQRGFARSDGACDLGAFEVQSAGDTDGDGIANGDDACPAGSGVGGDLDDDGCKNSEDPDDDGDGVGDDSDGCEVGDTGWTSSPATDHDADGCRDAGEDSDDDNDTVADAADQCPTGGTGTGSDPDGDGCKNAEDADDDDDAVPDASDSCPTTPGPASNSGCPPDITAPQTTIVKAKIKQERRKATFRFSSSEPDSSFRCKLDGQRDKPCSSPKTYKKLEPGRHRFRVSTSDASGNVDPTPAVKRFRIRR